MDTEYEGVQDGDLGRIEYIPPCGVKLLIGTLDRQLGKFHLRFSPIYLPEARQLQK